MHKNIKTVIGLALVVVILAIAYRISDGAGGFVKALGIEVSVDAQEPENHSEETEKKKVFAQFQRDFAFKDRECDTNMRSSVQSCVDAGYILDGVIGDVNITKQDRCGSVYVSFEKINKICGNMNVHLKGCGYDSLGDCVSHAFLEGEFMLQGYAYEQSSD